LQLSYGPPFFLRRSCGFQVSSCHHQKEPLFTLYYSIRTLDHFQDSWRDLWPNCLVGTSQHWCFLILFAIRSW
jgi:hypothetical protein